MLYITMKMRAETNAPTITTFEAAGSLSPCKNPSSFVIETPLAHNTSWTGIPPKIRP